jgi:hypothetical protein
LPGAAIVDKLTRRTPARSAARVPRGSTLPPPLFDLRDRLSAAFSLDELKDLGFTVGIEPESVPDDTRPMFALGVARAGWCRGCLEALLAEAARQRPERDWAMPTLPAPPEEGCEEDPLPRPSVFSDWRQVVFPLVLLLLVGAVIVGGLYLNSQPDRMTADFNVAVAGIDVDALGDQEKARQMAEMVNGRVVEILEDELRGVVPGSVAVSSERMRPVADGTAARELAEKVNAQLVVYGRLDGNDEQYDYFPSFYVNLDDLQLDLGEVQSSGSLETPLTFDAANPNAELPRTGQTALGAALLTNFARALVALTAEDIHGARRAIEAAAKQSEAYATAYGSFGGREVIHLFASQIARLHADDPARRKAGLSLLDLAEAELQARKTLDINPEYGRGYIALGNVQYDLAEYDPRYFAAALQTYKDAAALRGQPEEALVPLKAAFSLGNIHLYQLAYAQPLGENCQGEVRRWADEALRQYSTALAHYQSVPDPDRRLRVVAASAHFYRGQAHHLCGEFEAAAADYAAALALEPPPDLAQAISDMQAKLPAEEG